MTLSLEHIPCPESSLSRLDSRWKLAAVVLATAATAALRTLPASAAALATALTLAALARLPLDWYRRRLAGLAPFLVLLALLLPFCVRDPDPWAVWGPVSFSGKGLRLAVLISLKAVAILTFVLVLLATGPLHESLHAAHRLRVPGLLVHLSLLTYRYIFLVADELARLRIALRVRGYRNRATLHSYRTVAHVAGTLLVRSQERADRVAQAMRCRGFDGRFRSLARFQTRRGDVVAFLIISGCAAGLLLWDVWLRR